MSLFHFSVFDGTPRNKQQIDATSGGMGGEARKESNKSKVLYGLLKEPEINIRFEEDEEEKEGDETSKPKVTISYPRIFSALSFRSEEI